MADTPLPPSPSRVSRQVERLLGGDSLTARGRRASLLTLIGVGGRFTIKLGSNLILTRLLTPEIFGLMAIAQVFMQGIKMLSDVGASASVVRSDRGEDTAFLETAWSVQLIRGVIVAFLTLLIAWPVAQLYEQPILFPILAAISITAVFSGLSSISAPVANRKLMLWRLTLANLGSQFLVTVITITSAWMLQSVWALVIGAIIGSFVHMAMTHIILPPFRHRFRFEPEALREIITYGRWILLATACAFIASQGQQAIYGLLVPIDVLGTLAIAVLIASVPLKMFQKVLRQVIFPSFSEIRRERPKQIPRVLRKVRLTVIFTFFPIMFALSLLAQPIIDFLYDDRYALAGVFLALLPLNNSIAVLTKPYQNLLLADGASHLHALLMVISAVLSTAGIVLGYFVFGLVGSVACVGLAAALHFLANCFVAWRRGYATGLMDFVALGLVACVYAYVLMTLEVPSELLGAG